MPDMITLIEMFGHETALEIFDDLLLRQEEEEKNGWIDQSISDVTGADADCKTA